MQIFKESRFLKGTFLRRPNRFLVECDTGSTVVRAHLPNPGRLRELLLPGSTLFLQRHGRDSKRRTGYTAVAVEREGEPVLLHTSVTNDAAHYLLGKGLVPGLEGYRVARREVTVGRSRFDFLLRRNESELLLEVKSCTLFGKRIAMFPDAVTERGRRHVLELASLAEEGRNAGVLFLVHWRRAEFFLPEYHTDPLFAEALKEVRERVMLKAIAVSWRKDLTLSRRVREASIPWEVLEREGKDSGAYLVVLRLPRKRRIRVGSLGQLLFPRGFYIYVGSAERGLERRVERHRRLRKKMHWHIDWLRNEAEFHGAFPVRTADRLECEMARVLKRISDREVPGFGSSDCACRSHLFAMESDPLSSPAFIGFLQYMRIDRLTEGPCAPLFRSEDGGKGRGKVVF
jgi:sugar fermentation stimulation protein A